MEHTLASDASSPRMIATWRAFVKNLIQSSASPAPDAATLSELKRLALTAPHVLADIGFIADPKRSTPRATHWRRGETVVVISTETRTVSVILS